MSAHRGTSATGPTLTDGVQGTPATVDPRQVQFRNFGYAGAADETTLYHGLKTPWATQCLFAKLLRRMSDAPAGGGDTTNERIPAGYTYLAQLAAHDIIQNSSLNPLLAAREAGRRNEREKALLLDVLYGEGPSSNPGLYALPKVGEFARSLMRTGPMAPPSVTTMPMPAGACPFALRDLPRFQSSDLSDGPQTGRTDVLVADQRSDDNANIAQMTALFLHLHNAVAAALGASGLPKENVELPAGAYLFDRTRRVTTAIYRSVLQNDLLPRLIAKPIWDLYRTNGFLPLVDSQPLGVPVEFSHAAYRLGHAMVRLSYVFNDQHPEGEGLENVLLNRSSSRPYRFPISERWIADWSHFFEIAEAVPQFSRRIGPTVNAVLLSAYSMPIRCVGPDSTAIDPAAAGLLSEADNAALPDPNVSGLLFSDLVRGTIGGLLRLDALTELLPQAVRATSPLVGDEKRGEAIRSWLQASKIAFTEAELTELADNPPLMFWLLLEAASEQAGLCFGTMGSVIVGDVFMARFAASRAMVEDDPITQDLVSRLFPNGIPRTMPELILFVAATLNLGNAWPRFITPPTTPGV